MRKENGIIIDNSEIRTVREAMREMSAILEQLERGEISKIVLTNRGRMRAVLVSVDEYARLTSK
jgi:prevent-host-death family protein